MNKNRIYNFQNVRGRKMELRKPDLCKCAERKEEIDQERMAIT